jgi:fatty acid-binding protein DegV
LTETFSFDKLALQAKKGEKMFKSGRKPREIAKNIEEWANTTHDIDAVELGRILARVTRAIANGSDSAEILSLIDEETAP